MAGPDLFKCTVERGYTFLAKGISASRETSLAVVRL